MPQASKKQIDKLDSTLKRVMNPASFVSLTKTSPKIRIKAVDSTPFILSSLTSPKIRIDSEVESFAFKFKVDMDINAEKEEEGEETWLNAFKNIKDSGFAVVWDVKKNDDDDLTTAKTLVTISIKNNADEIKSAIQGLKMQYPEPLEAENTIQDLKMQYPEPLEINSAKTNSSVCTSTAIAGMFGVFAAQPIALDLFEKGVAPDIVLGVACASMIGCVLIGLAMGLVYDKVRSNATGAGEKESLSKDNGGEKNALVTFHS